MIDCLISGAQSGADLGGLQAAKELGIVTAGYMPRGWKTEDGPKPEYEEEFGMTEHNSPDYEDRTLANVKLADGTVIFGRRSVGSNLTEELCRKLGKPCAWIIWTVSIAVQDSNLGEMVIPTNLICSNGTISIHHLRPGRFRMWVAQKSIRVLNCAGNRESKNPGIGKFTKDFLLRALK